MIAIQTSSIWILGSLTRQWFVANALYDRLKSYLGLSNNENHHKRLSHLSENWSGRLEDTRWVNF